jgi:hypothetical protein
MTSVELRTLHHGPHRVIVDGVDLSQQVKKVEITVEGGEQATVTLTLAEPIVTAALDAELVERT